MPKALNSHFCMLLRTGSLGVYVVVFVFTIVALQARGLRQM